MASSGAGRAAVAAAARRRGASARYCSGSAVTTERRFEAKSVVQGPALRNAHEECSSDIAPVEYPQPGVNISEEESLFGQWGYKPPPAASQAHYGNRDSLYSTLTVTTQKAIRSPFEPKKVLPPPTKSVAIFGCTGWIGSRVAKRFVEAPEIEEVRLCTRYPDQVPPDLKKVIAINPDKCTLEETNVLDRPSINRAVQGVDCVINAVHLINEDFYNLHHDVYVKGTSNLGYQARLTGCKRFLQISGFDAQFNSDSDYGDFRAKAEDVALAEMFFSTVVRVGHLYGEGYRWRGLGKQFYPTPYPDTKLQPVWIGDLTEAIFRLLQDPQSVKRVVDLGGPKIMTHMQFAVERARIYGGPNPFPCPAWLATAGAFCMEYLFPNPWANQNMVCDYEMDQISRTPENNPHVWYWENIGMKPLTIAEAKKREDAGARL
eukprot:TRINITY_DN61383_c0_g1_i1.p1 TRINITY_DN61383_c0_g1~~TRINITY_DN61383_c0_g1_i1.p1  ORF type:complete len:432 (+),score=141.82 TRINITY_DN61383_c0_g1_i1:134-1429(+)